MPRRTTPTQTSVSSAFRQMQKQARELLMNLRKDIRTKEAELRRLRDEESRIAMMTGQGGAAAAGRAAGAAGGGGRINWRTVLGHLPKQFKASDIRKVRGLKDKRPSELFAAITRWIDAGMVKRKDRGLYERVG